MDDQQPAPIPHSRKTIFRSEILKYVFILPGTIWITAFTIVPLCSAVQFTFANYVLGRGITGYVGFANYINALWSPDFWYSLFITVIYVLIAVPLEVAL